MSQYYHKGKTVSTKQKITLPKGAQLRDLIDFETLFSAITASKKGIGASLIPFLFIVLTNNFCFKIASHLKNSDFGVKTRQKAQEYFVYSEHF